VYERKSKDADCTYFFFLAAFFFAGAFFFAFFLIAMTTSSWASLGKPLRVDYPLAQARTPNHVHRNPTAAEYRGAALQESRDDRRFGKVFLKMRACFFRVIGSVECRSPDSRLPNSRSFYAEIIASSPGFG
jgi:hypothetical protein